MHRVDFTAAYLARPGLCKGGELGPKERARDPQFGLAPARPSCGFSHRRMTVSGRNHARKLDRDPTSPPHTDAAATSRAKSLARGLFPHQVEGVAFLLRRRRAILADDMGLGKTRQAIVALAHAEPAGP